MEKSFSFSLVSPEKRLASGLASAVVIPGAEGDFTILKDHAPLLTALRSGKIRVLDGDHEGEYEVEGGFAEVSAEGLTILTI